MGDDRLQHRLSNVPSGCIILIEDVDAAFNKRTQTSEDGLVLARDHQSYVLTFRADINHP